MLWSLHDVQAKHGSRVMARLASGTCCQAVVVCRTRGCGLSPALDPDCLQINSNCINQSSQGSRRGAAVQIQQCMHSRPGIKRCKGPAQTHTYAQHLSASWHCPECDASAAAAAHNPSPVHASGRPPRSCRTLECSCGPQPAQYGHGTAPHSHAANLAGSQPAHKQQASHSKRLICGS